MTKTLKAAVSAIVLVASLAAQTALATKANALEPIEGSITFQGQPRTKLLKAPIGSTFTHRFKNYEETYRLREDRSLEIVSRRKIPMNKR